MKFTYAGTTITFYRRKSIYSIAPFKKHIDFEWQKCHCHSNIEYWHECNSGYTKLCHFKLNILKYVSFQNPENIYGQNVHLANFICYHLVNSDMMDMCQSTIWLSCSYPKWNKQIKFSSLTDLFVTFVCF